MLEGEDPLAFRIKYLSINLKLFYDVNNLFTEQIFLSKKNTREKRVILFEQHFLYNF